MARKDLRKQITIYPPNGGPGEKHSLLNSRDLITHSGWTTTPQHVDQFKKEAAVDTAEDQGEQFKPVAELLSNAQIEDTDEEAAMQALLNQPVDTMTLPQLHAYAEVAFGTKIDKRLNLNKALDRLQEIADASNFKLKFSDKEPVPEDEEQEEQEENFEDQSGDEQGADEDQDDEEDNK